MANLDYIAHLASESGGILYLMAGLLLVSLTVIIERSWYLTLTISHGEKLTREVQDLKYFDRAALQYLSRRDARFPHAELLKAPLPYTDLKDPIRLSGLLEEAMLLEARKIDRGIWILDTIVTLAPLLGLLGTIIGMFHAFDVLGKPGAQPTAVTGGIAEALVATACGLFIAIIGLVAYNSLNNSVRVIIHQLESIKAILVNRLDLPAPARSMVAEQAAQVAHGLSGARA